MNLDVIRENINRIRAEIPAHVEILAAAKTRSLDAVRAASEAGIRFFGHNYVQEAQSMIQAADFDAQWHLIGHLQRNKAKVAVELFDMVETLDSRRLGAELEKRCAAIGKMLPVLIEINSGREENKTGVLPEEALELAEWTSKQAYLKTMGLMTMGPLTGDPELSRPYFVETRRIFEEIKRMDLPDTEMSVLSMGMSNSYRVAIEEGATLIRLGTALFGPRKR